VNARTGREAISPERVLPDDQLLGGFLLKPMNCPTTSRSSRRNPTATGPAVRLAEFGTVYRWEQSGELNGMTACAASPRTTPTSSARRSRSPPS